MYYKKKRRKCYYTEKMSLVYLPSSEWNQLITAVFLFF